MLNQNWTVSVSKYLLNRRQAIKETYHVLHESSNGEGLREIDQLFKVYADTLFQVLLILLGDELFEGHTVFKISGESILDNDKKLMKWQHDLIENLIIDWQNTAYFIDLKKMHDHEPTGIEFMTHILLSDISATHFNRALLDITDIDHTQRNILTTKLKLANKLCDFFVSFNLLSSHADDSLNVFYHQLLHLPFFVSNIDLNSNYDSHTPIVLEFHQEKEIMIWLHRSWEAERSILYHINRLNHTNSELQPRVLDLSTINQEILKQEQLEAIHTANNFAFSIITGGPGTGKTYTVAQLVIALHYANQSLKVGEKPLSLVLAAPTGKAAQRMQESLQVALDRAQIDMNLQEAKTIHRLLGIGKSGKPRYNVDTPLSEDIVIVDEASMLGVELANYLISSIKTGARLILLGDPHQLSAVEAGAVLSDLCRLEHLQEVNAELIESTRFTADSAIGQFAKLVNQSEGYCENKLLKLFNNYSELKHYVIDISSNASEIYRQLSDNYHGYFKKTHDFLDLNSLNEQYAELSIIMSRFNLFRILTASHNGLYGDQKINEVMTYMHREYLKLPTSTSEWYHGRPVMVTKNNYTLGLFNGDVGLCLQMQEGLIVYFESKDKPIPISMLTNLEVVTSYAMTVHKSQGSEFEHVAIMLAGAGAKLLSREMLYTAVTRAKRIISVFSSYSEIKISISSPTIRRTGLALD